MEHNNSCIAEVHLCVYWPAVVVDLIDNINKFSTFSVLIYLRCSLFLFSLICVYWTHVQSTINKTSCSNISKKRICTSLSVYWHMSLSPTMFHEVQLQIVHIQKLHQRILTGGLHYHVQTENTDWTWSEIVSRHSMFTSLCSPTLTVLSFLIISTSICTYFLDFWNTQGYNLRFGRPMNISQDNYFIDLVLFLSHL